MNSKPQLIRKNENAIPVKFTKQYDKECDLFNVWFTQSQGQNALSVAVTLKAVLFFSMYFMQKPILCANKKWKYLNICKGDSYFETSVWY